MNLEEYKEIKRNGIRRKMKTEEIWRKKKDEGRIRKMNGEDYKERRRKMTVEE